MTLTVREDMPVSFTDLTNMAQAFAASGMFQDTRQVAQAIVKIQAGKELGLAPVYSMMNINVIRGRLTTSANTLALLVKRSGRYNYHIEEHTDLKCTITFFEDGKVAGESTFTMDDAKRAELVKPDSGWAKYPRAMLFSRAISQGARIYAPDAIGGVYTDEEIRSIPSMPQDEEPMQVNTDTGEVVPMAVEHFCHQHNTAFKKFEKDGKTWYSHPTSAKNQQGKTVWCNEPPAETGTSQKAPRTGDKAPDHIQTPPAPEQAPAVAPTTAGQAKNEALAGIHQQQAALLKADAALSKITPTAPERDEMMDWLVATLPKVKWTDKTLVSWVNAQILAKAKQPLLGALVHPPQVWQTLDDDHRQILVSHLAAMAEA